MLNEFVEFNESNSLGITLCTHRDDPKKMMLAFWFFTSGFERW
jgi:hypothetical protein